MIPHKHPPFNPEISTPTGNISDVSALRGIWRTLHTEEAASPPQLRESFARRRMALLAAFDEREIPQLIDELNQEAKEAFA